MAYNYYYPATYQPFYQQPGYQYQQPLYSQAQTQQTSQMTPTIHAEILQVDNETAATNSWPFFGTAPGAVWSGFSPPSPTR